MILTDYTPLAGARVTHPDIVAHGYDTDDSGLQSVSVR
jgi:hypothetical protein